MLKRIAAFLTGSRGNRAHDDGEHKYTVSITILIMTKLTCMSTCILHFCTHSSEEATPAILLTWFARALLRIALPTWCVYACNTHTRMYAKKRHERACGSIGRSEQLHTTHAGIIIGLGTTLPYPKTSTAWMRYTITSHNGAVQHMTLHDFCNYFFNGHRTTGRTNVKCTEISSRYINMPF